MLNEKGFEIEILSCAVCGEEFEGAPDDPTDLCECPSGCADVNNTEVYLEQVLLALT